MDFPPSSLVPSAGLHQNILHINCPRVFKRMLALLSRCSLHIKVRCTVYSRSVYWCSNVLGGLRKDRGWGKKQHRGNGVLKPEKEYIGRGLPFFVAILFGSFLFILSHSLLLPFCLGPSSPSAPAVFLLSFYLGLSSSSAPTVFLLLFYLDPSSSSAPTVFLLLFYLDPSSSSASAFFLPFYLGPSFSSAPAIFCCVLFGSFLLIRSCLFCNFIWVLPPYLLLLFFVVVLFGSFLTIHSPQMRRVSSTHHTKEKK
jgi:hypothetical protein